jgi:hypothetical protein
MTSPSTPIARFLETFQHASSTPGASAALFADTFLAAGPDGAKAVPAAAFGPVLEKRKQMFEQAGSRSTELISLEEIPLDARYAFARTRWRMTFVRDREAETGNPSNGQSLTVDSTFLIDLEAQRILVYLAHQDILAILRQRGIFAEPA